LQHIRMNEPAAAKLDPPRALTCSAAGASADEAAEVYFGRGLGEWEIGCPEAGPEVLAKHKLDEPLQSPLQICHRYVAIDVESLELEEHRIVGLVGSVAAEDAAGRDDSERRASPLHRANLHGRGLAPQRQVLTDIERVCGIPRGMAGRNIERVEVIERSLY